MQKSFSMIPKEKLVAIVQHRMDTYQAEERDARKRQKETKDHQKRLAYREHELIAHGKYLAATELLTEIGEYLRKIADKGLER